MISIYCVFIHDTMMTSCQLFHHISSFRNCKFICTYYNNIIIISSLFSFQFKINTYIGNKQNVQVHRSIQYAAQYTKRRLCICAKRFVTWSQTQWHNRHFLVISIFMEPKFEFYKTQKCKIVVKQGTYIPYCHYS